MPSSPNLTLTLLVLGVLGAAVHTSRMSYLYGTASGKTASWFLYCLGRRWPWVVWCHGALCGLALVTPREIAIAVVVFAAGHWWGAMSDHPDATGAAQ